ncbi:Transcription termination factor mitochondrial/chloroplastic protein [Dioscorea alata]|uniref:Transcription termination factor mitochondrial/chloroplastic protein n=1 Tax=Dioscorea alata TaxID=55571 RepID=A0ACB7VIJ1_DIOAL|nr:Transcription termination factor mitochondrial/chloroplastic protein [Dioscorea alata]
MAMAQLGRLRRPSHFSLVDRINLKNQLKSSKASLFSGFDDHWCVKKQSLHLCRALQDKRLVFSTWASRVCSRNQFETSKIQYFCSKCTLFREKLFSLSVLRGLCTDGRKRDSKFSHKNTQAVVKGQAAFVDYLHATRGLQFTDAEHISKNSPIFLGRLLKKVENEEDVERALMRYFRYHPIYEFEPFFESLGLKPSEYNQLLPRDLMFLSDDEMLLENYHVLCNYGIARGKIGKIYKEAAEVFKYDFGLLSSKLQAYEGLGLSKTNVIKLVASSPQLLVREVDRMMFVKVLELLESMGIQRDWIGGILSEKNTYNWGRTLMLLHFLHHLGLSSQEVAIFIRKQPNVISDGSGKAVFLLIGLLVKMGGREKEVIAMFTQFPSVQIGSYIKNVLRGLQFLIGIEMDHSDIQNLICTHMDIFGMCKLKRPNSIITTLNVGKKRLCRIIKNDPHELKKYAFGLKVTPLPNSGDDERSLMEKKKFLLRLGFVENSKEMNKALKVFRGKGDDLQNRYDFLVKAGFDANDVSNMIKMAPQILNQKIDVLQRKLDFLLNNLGYPLSTLVAFPSYMSYTVGRVKLRFLMYDWLKDRARANPGLALSSVLACSDKLFIKRFVNCDPKGPEVWENFKKGLSSG